MPKKKLLLLIPVGIVAVIVIGGMFLDITALATNHLYWNIERDATDQDKLKFYFQENKPDSALVLTPDGKVGLSGNTNPQASLSVGKDTLASNTRTTLRLGNGGWSNPSAPGTSALGDKLLFWDGENYKVGLGFAGDNSLWFQVSTNDAAIRFFTGLSGNNLPQERVTITNSGGVGIGTTNPGSDKLDVRGRAYASEGWQSTDADYAEWFEKEEATNPGDIIGLNLKTGQVRKYQSGDKFLGIHSKKPAFVGNRLIENDQDLEKTHTLVGLLGQLDFNPNQVKSRGRVIYTLDGQEIGVILSNNKVFIGR